MTTHHTDEKKPALGGLIENRCMNELDYVEQRSTKTLEVARQAYDDLHERAYKLATVLVTGGGAVTAYVLSKAGAATSSIGWAPLAGLALSWFVIAAYLIWCSLTSNELSPGNSARNLLGYYDARLGEGHSKVSALDVTRRAELDAEQKRLDEYKCGCIQRAKAIDRAYKAIAIASPLVPISVAAVIKFLDL